jgi:hypothetical protein
MKMTARRHPANTAKSAARAHENAAQAPLEPPAYVSLPADARPFWDAIVSTRGRDLWTPVDLAQAANLARVQCAVQSADVGSDAHARLSRLSMALCRSIAVHPTATVGRAADQVNANALERNARQAAGDADDELLPRRPQMFVV